MPEIPRAAVGSRAGVRAEHAQNRLARKSSGAGQRLVPRRRPPPSTMSASEAPPTPERGRRVFPLLALCVLVLAAPGLCVLFALPRFKQMLQPNPQQETLSQARRIYNACQAFNAVRGKLPGTLEFLVPDFLAERRDLADPGHPESGDIGFLYYGTGKTSAEPGDSIFLAAKAE